MKKAKGKHKQSHKNKQKNLQNSQRITKYSYSKAKVSFTLQETNQMYRKLINKIPT